MNVRELFSSITPTYDLLNRVLSLGTDQRWRRRGVGLLPHGPEMRVLDLACGTLDLALAYLKQGEGEVCGVDFAFPMLQAGQKKVRGMRDEELGERLQMICGDGLVLPFPNGFFDSAMCAWGVRNFPDNAASLREIRRVLKPGGLFLVIEFFRPTRPAARLFSRTYGRHIMPAVGRWISKDKNAYEYLHRSIREFLSRNEYEGLLKENGFSIQESQDLTGGISSLILGRKNADTR